MTSKVIGQREFRKLIFCDCLSYGVVAGDLGVDLEAACLVIVAGNGTVSD